MAHSASFRRASSCLTRAIAVGVASSALFLAGCDNATSKADKDVTSQLDEAVDMTTGSEANRLAAQKTLEDAARDATASFPVRIRAKVLLADSELHTAQELALQVQANDVLIDRLAREIGLLGGDIANNNRQAAALQKYEPSSIQDAITQKQTDVKGSDDKPDWYKSGESALASLSADDKQAAALQAQVSQLQDTIKTETDQRNQLLEDSDKLTQQSYHEKKDKSVDLFVQGSDARKKAADLTVKLDQDNVALGRAQADLAVRQGQHESLSTALKTFDAKSSATAEDWTAVQAKIAELNADSKKVLGEDPVTAPAKDAKTGDLASGKTIGSKAAAVFELAKLNHDLRGIAETHYNSAVGFYKDAADYAQQLGTALSEKINKKADPAQSPDAVAFTDERATLDPANYLYLEGDAELQKAEFYARGASERKVRLDLFDHLKAIFTPDQAKLAESLKVDDTDGTIAKELKDAQASARDSFGKSADLLDHVSNGTATTEQRLGAQVQEVFAQYGWWALETSAGDPQKAAEHLTQAKTLAIASVQSNATMPALPAELSQSAPTTPGPGAGTGTADKGAAATGASPVGTYKNQVTGPANTTIAQVLEIKADGTFVMNATMTVAGKDQAHNATGTWVQTGTKVVCTVKVQDGTPMPANSPEANNTVTIADGGKKLVNADGTPDFIRQ